jgi:hypothetical protein
MAECTPRGRVTWSDIIVGTLVEKDEGGILEHSNYRSADIYKYRRLLGIDMCCVPIPFHASTSG